MDTGKAQLRQVLADEGVRIDETIFAQMRNSKSLKEGLNASNIVSWSVMQRMRGKRPIWSKAPNIRTLSVNSKIEQLGRKLSQQSLA
jgi:hypothetical protein